MYLCTEEFDVIVVGAGHAGCEAGHAAARMGMKTLLVTIHIDTVAQMSCNPAIGGIGKTHLVREVDALGGIMAQVIDATGIQFRMLNTRKGPAVQALRAQADRRAYSLLMTHMLEKVPNLELKQGIVDEIMTDDNGVSGVVLKSGIAYRGRTVIITAGTFLKGLIHIGESRIAAGRIGEPPSEKLSESLRALGFTVDRLKTGTPARLNARSLDYSVMRRQDGDENPAAFSFLSEHPAACENQPQVPCFITRTTEKTHEIIRSNFDRAPLFTGQIQGAGPRYCPSIEDKVHRFSDKDSHQVFIEPEGRDTQEVYPNGISTSLPYDVQVELIHSIPGLENAEIIRPGYAIEYDYCDPRQLYATLETKKIPGLFLAGQVNGTSGYEEAAAQGMMAAINAVAHIKNEEPLILGRDEAYIAVMIDDLVTRGVTEPYRMFTSRAEHRLLLRQDNADLRLTEYGRQHGIVDDIRYELFARRRDGIARELDILHKKHKGQKTLAEFVAGPNVTEEIYVKTRADVTDEPAPPDDILLAALVECKYAGYIERQRTAIRKAERFEKKRIPSGIEYTKIPGMRNEAKQRLSDVQPHTVGQAQRIEGITPADCALLSAFIEKWYNENNDNN